MTLVATLTPAADGGIFTMFSEVIRLADGRYLVANEQQPGEIEVYSSDGMYMYTVGREGDGPGEYRYIKELLVIPPDSIGVADISNGRLTVLDAHLQPIRSLPFPYRHREAVWIGSDQYLINASLRTLEQAGYPLHLVNGAGSIMNSFGASSSVFRADLVSVNSRPLAYSPDGTIWAGYAGQYILEAYTPEGKLMRRLVRVAEWFPPWLTVDPITPATPPNPALIRLQVDGEKHLWALSLTPAPDFTNYLVERNSNGKIAYAIDNYSGLFDSVLEVFNVTGDRLLASEHVSQALFGFADANHVVGYREGNDLLPRLDVWRVTLQGGAK